MTIYIVRWNEEVPDAMSNVRAKKHCATSSYSAAQKLFKQLSEQAKNEGDVSIGALDEAIEKVTLKKKPEYIDLLNRI